MGFTPASLDHNRSRFGFSATLARLPVPTVPRARLDRHDETSSTGPPSEEQPLVEFHGALTHVIHRQESHIPSNRSIQTKSFAATQPPSRTLGSHHQRQLDQPDPKKVRALQAGIGVADGPVRLSRVGVGSAPAVFMRHLASGIGLCGVGLI